MQGSAHYHKHLSYSWALFLFNTLDFFLQIDNLDPP